MNKILTVPNASLRKVSKPVISLRPQDVKFAEGMAKLVSDDENSAGIAAPQLGVSLRIIAVKMDFMNTIIIINPEITKRIDSFRSNESCLSLPGKRYQIKRSKIVKITGLGLDGKRMILKGRGLLAAIFQHEVDHLNGILIDRPVKSL